MDETEQERPRKEGWAAPRRARWALLALGAIIAVTLALVVINRTVMVRPGAAQMVVLTRDGEVTRVVGPGQWGFTNPWTQSRLVVDTALIAADRSLPNRGMAAVSAEGHPLTLFGVAYWRESGEDDIRWRATHIRPAQPDAMGVLMAATVQAVVGRHAMDDVIRRTADLQAALTEELRTRARALLRVEVVSFVVTALDPGESYRQVVAERELGRARAASVAASPAMTSDNPNAVEVERIRRWDGRGVIPELRQPDRDGERGRERN